VKSNRAANANHHVVLRLDIVLFLVFPKCEFSRSEQQMGKEWRRTIKTKRGPLTIHTETPFANYQWFNDSMEIRFATLQFMVRTKCFS